MDKLTKNELEEFCLKYQFDIYEVFIKYGDKEILPIKQFWREIGGVQSLPFGEITVYTNFNKITFTGQQHKLLIELDKYSRWSYRVILDKV